MITLTTMDQRKLGGIDASLRTEALGDHLLLQNQPEQQQQTSESRALSQSMTLTNDADRTCVVSNGTRLDIFV